jgi:hypothetical protein
LTQIALNLHPLEVERRNLMKTSNVAIRLSYLIVVLALIAAGVGLFYQDGGSAFSFTSVRGVTVQVYGQGFYRYDTPIGAVGARTGDAVILVLAIPLLVFAAWGYRRGSLRGGLLLAGVLAFFLYSYGSMAIGAAYNNLFIVYVALLSASFFALIFLLASFDVQALPAHFSNYLPCRGISIYLITSGIVLALVWLVLSIVPALLEGKAPPEASYYTTFITGALDVGIIAPTLITVGILLLRRTGIGYLLAPTVLVFTVVLGTSLTLAGIAQLLAGVVTIGQFIGFTVGFTVLTLFALGFTMNLFRNFSDAPTAAAK